MTGAVSGSHDRPDQGRGYRAPTRRDPSPSSHRDTSVKAVERSIDLLLLLADAPMTLTQLSERSKMSKTTVQRLLSTLGHGGLVVRDPITKDHRLGPGCLRLGQGFISGKGGFEILGRGALQRLWSSTGETVAVHIRLGKQRVCVDELPSAEPLRLVSGVGMAAPLHVGSAGRVLLAWLPDAEVAALLEGTTFDESGHAPVRSLAALQAELVDIRERGYALSEGERVVGASAVSVPVHGPDGVMAALSVLGPGGRFTLDKRLAALEDLNAAAQEIGRSLALVHPADEGRTSSVPEGVRPP